MLISARRLVMLYISTKFCNYLKRYHSYGADTISILKISKGSNSAKNAGGVTVVNLCTSSGHVYICAKFREIVSNGIKLWSGYERSTADGRTDGRTDGQTKVRRV